MEQAWPCAQKASPIILPNKPARRVMAKAFMQTVRLKREARWLKRHMQKASIEVTQGIVAQNTFICVNQEALPDVHSHIAKHTSWKLLHIDCPCCKHALDSKILHAAVIPPKQPFLRAKSLTTCDNERPTPASTGPMDIGNTVLNAKTKSCVVPAVQF